MGQFMEKDNRFIWRYNGETMVIEAWGKNSLRIRAVMMGDILDTDFALLKPSEKCIPDIAVDRRRATVTNGKIKAVIAQGGWAGNCQISFYNQKNELLFQELDFGSRKYKPIIGGDYKITAQFKSDENEKLYGMGQYQQNYLNVKGLNFELAHRNTQASIPFVMSNLGYGFFWHNPAIGTASFAKNRTEWYAESSKQLDYWVTAGDTPAEIEEAFADATGKVPMMPEYGLGFWQCKLRYWNQEQLLEVAREYKRRNLPIDVIVCDFFHWPKMGDFRFDKEFFPDPKAMVDELKAMDIELMVSVWPQISLESENFREMMEKGLLIKPEAGVNITMRFGGDSVFFDATNEEARQYVWDKCKQNYYDYGIKVFWLDEAEPEYAVYDFDNYRYKMGPNVQIGNVYPQVFSRTFYDGMVAEGQKDVVNLVRCAWAGSQRYGALVWSGDIFATYETLRRQVCTGLNMGIAGIPWWNSDIGGFFGGKPDDEQYRKLLIRWFQFGTFCPVMRLHGDRSPYTPVVKKDGSTIQGSGGNNEVWSFGEEAYPILVKYMNLREAMRPYTRELMKQAHENGTPVMRTMFYEFPEDEKCWDLKEQYMFGGDILVAPVLYEDAEEINVYLPNGASWTSLNDGTVYSGGQEITLKVCIDSIPVFARNGSHSELNGKM